MNSLILRVVVRLMMPVLFLFSFFLLLRGHNLPGGGFIGGLVAAAAFILYLLTLGVEAARNWFPIPVRYLAPVGVLLAVTAGLIGTVAGEPFLTGIWTTVNVASLGEVSVGTPLLFDIGVYLVVVGMVVESIIAMAEEESWIGF